MRQGYRTRHGSTSLCREPAERESQVGLAIAVERGCCLLVCGAGPMPTFLGKETGQAPQCGQDMGGVGVADLTAVLVVRAIPDIVIAGLDGPVPPHDPQQQRGILLGIR